MKFALGIALMAWVVFFIRIFAFGEEEPATEELFRTSVKASLVFAVLVFVFAFGMTLAFSIP